LNTLADELDALTAAQPFAASWYLKRLDTQQEWDRDGDLVVATRSTRKVAIMMSLLQWARQGGVRLTDQVVIRDEYRHTRSGLTQYFLADPVLRLHDAMTMMIGVSDNGCTGAIVELLGLARINAFCKAIGMHETAHRSAMPLATADESLNTVSTPREQGLLLQAILDGSTDPKAAARLGCLPEDCALALNTLASQQLRSKIPALLPANASCAHKDGTGPGMHHDTGIVYRSGVALYILCAYTREVPLDADGEAGAAQAARFIAQLSRKAWDAFDR
jgi:beta-lactamase class A